MEKRTYFCDVCGKEVAELKDLKVITIGNGGDWSGCSSYNRFEVYKKFDMCLDCRTKIGAVLPEKPTVEERRSIENRLYDIVEEIVSTVMPQQH